MQKYRSIITYASIATVALLVLALGGWYFFLSTQEGTIVATDEARGFGIAVPSFTGSRSSTAENMAAGSTESLLYVPQENQKPPRLWKASQNPVAGMGWVGTTTVLRYVERSTGHIYDVDPTQGKAVRHTNTLMPRIYDAAVLFDGAVVLHTLGETGARLSILGHVSTTTVDGYASLDGVELGNGVLAVAPSPSRAEMLITGRANDGSGILIRSTSEGDAPESVAPLPLSSFVPIILGDNRIFVTERPASGVPGNMYEVEDGALYPVLRAIPGLVALPRAGSNALLFSADNSTRLALFARPGDTSTVNVSLETTAAKCVWAPIIGTTTPNVAYCAAPQTTPPTQFTDKWMRGQVHTQDSWFTVDVSAAKSDKLFSPETSTALDVERPLIDSTGEYIAFINARDKSLWVLRLKE